MAQGPITALQTDPVPSMASKIPAALSEEEELQLRECERILQFRDEVLSGAHPRIKVPAHLGAAKKSSESRSPGSLAVTAPSGPAAALMTNVPTGPKSTTAKVASPATGSEIANNLRSFNANSHLSVAAASNIASGRDSSSGSTSTIPGVPTGPKSAAPARYREPSGSAQFDPVLLTKSDDLIKAEIQLQRKRLESALSEQVQQHRAARNSHVAEAPVEFDLADVLMKALKLVQTSALPHTDANLAANASGTDGDSFDDDTFYSSKHDTPESHQTHRLLDRDESGGPQAREDSHYEPPLVIQASPVPEQQPAVAMTPFVLSCANATQTQQHREQQALAPDLSNRAAATYSGGCQAGAEATGTGNTNDVPMEIASSQESGEASSSRDSGQAGANQQMARHHLESVTQQLIDQGFGRHQSPILRAHNLSPIAPQPAHVSPLATARQPPVLQLDAHSAQATPAQVAALRNDHSNGSSPESSPQGGKASKKAKKKNKRKADRMATNTVPSPYIKPEPRSPSPLTAPPQFTRPTKRQKQAQRPAQSGYDQARIEEPVEVVAPYDYPRVYREERIASGYNSPSGQRPRQDTRHMIVAEPSRYERDYHEALRPAEAVQYVRRSPGAPAYPYGPGEVQTIRSVSRAAIERPYPFYDVRDPPRTVVRQAADRDRSRSPVVAEDRSSAMMGPPRLPRSRIVHIDEFGREYLDPVPRSEGVVTRRSVVPRPVYDGQEEYYEMPRSTTVIQRSVAPLGAYGEPEIVYQRPPPSVRASSAMPGGPQRYDEEVIYHRPASPSGYATTRRVVTRPAEYAVPEYRYYRERDYQGAPPAQAGDDYYDRRPVEEAPREYRIRATTVRPEAGLRPEVVRMSSVRPEHVPGSYGAPILLDERQAVAPPRPYSTRPIAPPPPPPPPLPQQQQQHVRPWPEYEARPYPDQVEEVGDDGGVTYLESAPREMYR